MYLPYIQQLLSMEFIVGQLLDMARFFDLADEAGRLNMHHNLCELLQHEKTSPTLTRTMVKCISLIEPNLEVRIVKLLEVISELREPLTQAEVPISEEQQRKNKLEVNYSKYFKGHVQLLQFLYL